MRCESCGNENEMNNQFCTKCGSKLGNEQPNLNEMYNQPSLNQMYTQNNQQNNNQPMNNQVNQPMQMNNPTNNQQNNGPMQMNMNQQNNGQMQMNMQKPNNDKDIKKEKNKKTNGMISIVIAILCVPVFFISSVCVIPLSFAGLIVGIRAGKKGLVGAIINGLIFVIIMAILALGLFVIFNNGYKMYGTYKCTSYYDSYTEEDIKNITEDDLEIEFKINLDDTFTMTSKEVDVKGNFELTETKTSEMYDTDYYYLNMTADYRKISGKEYTEPFETQYVFAITGDKRKAAYVYNPKSMSQYICRRELSW